MPRYLVYVTQGGLIDNAVEWNGNTAIWQPPSRHSAVQRNTGNTGDTYNAGNGTVTPAPPTTPPVGPPPQAVSVGPSPFTILARSVQTIIISGGTVSLIQFSRDGTARFAVGETSGMFTLGPGDRLIVTYTVAPTITRALA